MGISYTSYADICRMLLSQLIIVRHVLATTDENNIDDDVVKAALDMSQAAIDRFTEILDDPKSHDYSPPSGR